MNKNQHRQIKQFEYGSKTITQKYRPYAIKTLSFALAGTGQKNCRNELHKLTHTLPNLPERVAGQTWACLKWAEKSINLASSFSKSRQPAASYHIHTARIVRAGNSQPSQLVEKPAKLWNRMSERGFEEAQDLETGSVKRTAWRTAQTLGIHSLSCGIGSLFLFLCLNVTLLGGGLGCAGKPPRYIPRYDTNKWDAKAKPDFDFPDGADVHAVDNKAVSELEDADFGQQTPDVGSETDTSVDLKGPYVLGAFSPDGERITIRFDEKIDPQTGSKIENYVVMGSNMAQIDISSVEVFKQFAHLYLTDPSQINPALTYTVLVEHVEDLAGNPVDPQHNKATIKRPIYLSIVWHQHQPFYLDPVKDQLTGPWVRKHATKDYYDMAELVGRFPDVHLNINITMVLLIQLQIYLDRLGPYVDVENSTVDEEGFLAKWKGKTDPWIDLLLEDTPSPETATEKQLGLLYSDPWACVSTSEVQMKHFPQYVEIREKNPKLLTQEDFLKLKILFEIAWFDPDFLNGPVQLPDGSVVDLTDVLQRSTAPDKDGTPMDVYYVTEFSEELANRLVAEEYKIMANIIPIHKKLMYNPDTKQGQIEIISTPLYHPILPLIANTDSAKAGQPYDPLPSPPYQQEQDAFAQVLRSMALYEKIWGTKQRGTWCGEGSVSEDIVHILVDAGLKWTATDQKVLERSTIVGGGNPDPYIPYKIDSDKVEGTGGDADDEMIIVFRDTALSNKVGFIFQLLDGKTAASEFIKDVLAQAPKFGSGDRLVTVILDGENAWENYQKDFDGKLFLTTLYESLAESYQVGEIVPVTLSEYIDGNPDRGIPPHPIAQQKELEPLWAGSWIDATFSIWIGEPEENQAWEYLRTARQALAISGLPQPNPSVASPPPKGTLDWLIWKAYDEIYAAEGSDWFWWYGADMTSPANDDTPFDKAFRTHLHGMYTFMNQALEAQGKPIIDEPEFAPIVQKKPQAMQGPFETPPTIDGIFTPNEGEWDTYGGFFYDNDSGGTMAGPNDDIAQVYFGYQGNNFYLAILFNEDLSAKLGSNYEVCIYTNQKHITNPETGDYVANPFNTHTRQGIELQFKAGGAAWEIRTLFNTATAEVELNAADGDNNWNAAPHDIQLGGPVPGGKLLEYQIPLSSLEMSFGDPLEIFIVAAEGTTPIDTAPYTGSVVIFEDITTMVYVTFMCDVTGKLLPIDTYVDIETPPPPKGNGIVYIVGNQPQLGLWIPNKIALVDNGEPPDEVAGDGVWSATFGFSPGTMIRYKYTIGLPKDENKWKGTEEFPLTERGFDVTMDPQYHKMIIRDVFADRPNPTGTLGPHTQVEYLK